MGKQTEQAELFSYEVNLDRRVRSDHPLRKIREIVDFGFVREEVAHCYGTNGQVSVDPEVILKLMFLLFYDNVRSERELMRMLPERLDYLWFLGFGLDDLIPDHSVLSKARARWGQAVFERLFIRTVQQCAEARLVDGTKLHLDGSLINADASCSSVVSGPPELISELKRAYQVQERKLTGNLANRHYQPVSQTKVSPTDPDAPLVRNSKFGGSADSRPRYKQHRAVDDRCGVITAIKTTPGDVDEPKETLALIEQHHQHTGQPVQTVVADQQYGTNANYRDLQRRGVRTHMGRLFGRGHGNIKGIYPAKQFTYDAEQNRYICPAGQHLYPRRRDPRREVIEYATRKGVCAACALREHCTRAKNGRTLMRHDD